MDVTVSLLFFGSSKCAEASAGTEQVLADGLCASLPVLAVRAACQKQLDQQSCSPSGAGGRFPALFCSCLSSLGVFGAFLQSPVQVQAHRAEPGPPCCSDVTWSRWSSRRIRLEPFLIVDQRLTGMRTPSSYRVLSIVGQLCGASGPLRPSHLGWLSFLMPVMRLEQLVVFRLYIG